MQTFTPGLVVVHFSTPLQAVGFFGSQTRRQTFFCPARPAQASPSRQRLVVPLHSTPSATTTL
jgi:hypothetical protein